MTENRKSRLCQPLNMRWGPQEAELTRRHTAGRLRPAPHLGQVRQEMGARGQSTFRLSRQGGVLVTSLVVQWFGICTFTAEGLIPARGTKVLNCLVVGPKKNPKKTEAAVSVFTDQINQCLGLVHLDRPESRISVRNSLVKLSLKALSVLLLAQTQPTRP